MNKVIICAVPGVSEDNVFDTEQSGAVHLIMGNKLSLQSDYEKQQLIEDYYELRLNKVEYDKKIFSPGEMKLHFTITSVGKPSCRLSARLRDEFVKNECMVDLFGIGEGVEPATAGCDDRVFIARNYYVSSIGLDSGGAGQSCVLKCYSYDRHLTEDKYCDVFTGKKFGEEIFKAILTGDSIKKRPEINFSVKRLLMMAYSGDKRFRNGFSEKNGVQEVGHDTELIQPHLIQYNESIYDFLCQVAHKCGEFLYFEDGKLNLGLPEDTIKFLVTGKSDRNLTISPAPFCSYGDISMDEESDVKNFASDYLNENRPASGKCYDMQYTSDSLCGANSLRGNPLPNANDNYVNQKSTGGEWIAYKAVSTVFTSDDFITGLTTALLTAAWDAIYSNTILPPKVDKLSQKKTDK